MFVRDCMTPDPFTVRPESDPLAGMMLLRAGRFRHLPVVEGDGKLVGIVDHDSLELFLSRAGSPGVTKRQHRVDQVMARDVLTVTPDCPLEEAAALMVSHKVNSLLVVTGERLVGIITETDIFKQLAAALGGGGASLRLTVQVADTPGQLAELAGRIAGVDGNICSVVSYTAGRSGRINITLRVEGADRDTLLGALSDLPGLDVLNAWECSGEEREPS
jgi:acetoin utilization protein AcuB